MPESLAVTLNVKISIITSFQSTTTSPSELKLCLIIGKASAKYWAFIAFV
jgi:hypothetical protein